MSISVNLTKSKKKNHVFAQTLFSIVYNFLIIHPQDDLLLHVHISIFPIMCSIETFHIKFVITLSALRHNAYLKLIYI